MGFILLKGYFSEQEILDMTLDKFDLYISLVDKKVTRDRLYYIDDTIAAISSIGGTKEVEKYRNSLARD